MRCRPILYVLIAIASITGPVLAQKDLKPPETFVANAQALGQKVGAAAEVTVQIDQYTSDINRNVILEALRTGGFPSFLPALRSAPQVGYVEMAGRKVAVRWARQEATSKGRTITIVTESPLLFLGGASVDAKPRKGFDVAVIRMDVDSIGLGTGSMAAAARVTPGGVTGVKVDDYSDTPITLATVRKLYR
jgi:hypothetical protein